MWWEQQAVIFLHQSDLSSFKLFLSCAWDVGYIVLPCCGLLACWAFLYRISFLSLGCTVCYRWPVYLVTLPRCVFHYVEVDLVHFVLLAVLPFGINKNLISKKKMGLRVFVLRYLDSWKWFSQYIFLGLKCSSGTLASIFPNEVKHSSLSLNVKNRHVLWATKWNGLILYHWRWNLVMFSRATDEVGW